MGELEFPEGQTGNPGTALGSCGCCSEEEESWGSRQTLLLEEISGKQFQKWILLKTLSGCCVDINTVGGYLLDLLCVGFTKKHNPT